MSKAVVETFLKKTGIHPDSVVLSAGTEAFVGEMKDGLNGAKSSLKMLCTYISPEGDIPVNEKVIVMDAGGTNFRVAVVHFDEKRDVVVEDFRLFPMPGTKGELSKEEFFESVANSLMPVIDKSDKIGFCFSYPTEILPNKDGRLIHFNKEVRVRDMEGQEIGSELLRTLKAKGVQGEKHIVLLNDTVATLLGGKAAFPNRKFDSYIGFILGTGTNTCYVEDNAQISQAPSLKDIAGSTLINIESGGYNGAPRGVLDDELDAKTTDPGRQAFEKMISGAYQGPLLQTILDKAVAEGLFSTSFAASYKTLNAIVSKDIDDFCFYPYSVENVLGGCVNANDASADADRDILYALIDAMFERAAKLVAINLAAVIEKSGKGRNPLLPVCVAAEGTTFYKSKLFKVKLDYYVRSFLNDEKGLYCEFVKTDNCTLIGTAIAGLLN